MEINFNLGENSLRTTAQQRIVEKFKGEIANLPESLGEGKTSQIIKSLRRKPEYQSAMAWIPKDLDVILQELNKLRFQWGPDVGEDRKLFLDALYELLDSESLVLSDTNVKNFADYFRFESWSNWKNGIVWWKMSEKLQELPVSDKEKFFSYGALTPLYKIPMIEEILEETNHKEWIFYMFLLLGARWQIGDLSSESQNKIMESLFSNDEDIWRIITFFASENIPSHPMDESWGWRGSKDFINCWARCRYLPYKMKEKIKDFILDFDKVDSLIESDHYHVEWSIAYFFEMFDIKIPLKIAKRMWGWVKLKDYIDIEEAKKAVNNLFESNDDTFIPILKHVFGWKRLWDNVDDKYKNPEYLNSHAEYVADWLWDSKRRKLLKKLELQMESEPQDGKILKTSKYNSKFIPKDLKMDDLDLVIATVELDENCHPRMLYKVMKKKGALDKNSLFTIISGIVKGARNVWAEKQFMIDIMADVYNCKENWELIKMVFDNFNYFAPHFSAIQENKLVENFIDLMTTCGDLSGFFDAIYDKKIFKWSLLLWFRYFLWASETMEGKDEYEGDFGKLLDKVLKLIRIYSVKNSSGEISCCWRKIPDCIVKSLLMQNWKLE